jgi:dihydroorotate dehydrogenase (NAD+) catalytic subunit
VGLGGVEKAEDALEYMIVGAAAVQVGTASFCDPAACEKIIANLEKACRDLNVPAISNLIGTLERDCC